MQLVINVPKCPDYICVWLHTQKNILKKIIIESIKNHLQLFKIQIALEATALTDTVESLIIQQWNFLIETDFSIAYQSNCLKFAEFIAQSEINIKLIHKIYSAILKKLHVYALEQNYKNSSEILFYLHELATTDLINLVSVRSAIHSLKLNSQKELVEHTIKNSIFSALEEISQQIATISATSSDVIDSSKTCIESTNYLDNSSQKLHRQTVALTDAVKQLIDKFQNISDNLTNHSDNTQKNEYVIKNTTQDIQDLATTTSNIYQSIRNLEIIAKQADLLSINANIEAVRAGNANKGFTVVAAEIKNLATQTAATNRNILDQINAIQNATDKVITTITDISDAITSNTNQSLIDEMGKTIKMAEIIHNILLDIQTTNENFSNPLKTMVSSASKIDIASKRLQIQTNLVNSSTKYFAKLPEKLKSL